MLLPRLALDHDSPTLAYQVAGITVIIYHDHLFKKKFFETVSHDVAQEVHKLVILLFYPPEC
jgi:hypothetical protein